MIFKTHIDALSKMLLLHSQIDTFHKHWRNILFPAPTKYIGCTNP